MKKTILITLFSTFAIASGAQEVLRVQNGAVVTVQPGTQVTVLGGVTLATGSTLTNNGTITVKGNTISGTGDWADNTTGGYQGTGTLVFNHTGVQTITSTNTIERIEVNNGGLNLGSNISSNKWYLVNGPVNTGAFRAIALNTSPAAIEAGAGNTNFANSWINGNLRRYINPATENSYTFPVGNGTQHNLAEMDNLTASPLTNITYIDAFFAPKVGTDDGLAASERGVVYSSIHDGGVWHLVPDAEPTGGRYDLKLYLNGFGGLTDNRFTILRRPEGSVNAAEWRVPPGSIVEPDDGDGRLVAHGYARRNNISTFSEFAIGILSASLPVTLARFDAKRSTRTTVLVTWETETEQNNKGFYIERRLDNETTFDTKGFVASQAPDGNSTLPLNYSYNDANSYTGISYYRLRQVDLDNRAHYSLIKAVDGSGTSTISVLIMPNPSHGQFKIRMEGIDESKQAIITDITGKTVQRLVVNGTQEVNVHGLSAGTYVLTILNAFGKDGHFTEKIIVVR